MSIEDLYFARLGKDQRPMAASREAILCSMQIVREAGLRSILDCGSGLSTVFFHSEFEYVVTVDDDAAWADRTKQSVEDILGKRIAIGNLNDIRDRFDFVFYDYGNIESRIFYFRQALNLCRNFMYLDDMHVPYYRAYVEAKCAGYPVTILPQTEDAFGRYGAILKK